MKYLFAIAIISLFVIACGKSSTDNNSTASTTENKTEAVANGPDGEKIYKQYCITCHGLYGDMGASGAFNLQQSKLSVDERVGVITNGRPNTAMVGFKSILDDDKIKAVAQYTLKLKK